LRLAVAVTTAAGEEVAEGLNARLQSQQSPFAQSCSSMMRRLIIDAGTDCGGREHIQTHFQILFCFFGLTVPLCLFLFLSFFLSFLLYFLTAVDGREKTDPRQKIFPSFLFFLSFTE
jgi:hypothetical protein